MVHDAPARFRRIRGRRRQPCLRALTYSMADPEPEDEALNPTGAAEAHVALSES